MLKISQLAELTNGNIVDGDYLEILDTSDTTTMGSPDGANKKVLVSSLANKVAGGITKTSLGLGNVTNESKATMFTSPTFTGTVTLPDATITASKLNGGQNGAAPIYAARAWVSFDGTKSTYFTDQTTANVDRDAGSTTATVVTDFNHGLSTGNSVVVLTGVVAATYTVTRIDDKTFTITTVATTALTDTLITFKSTVSRTVGSTTATVTTTLNHNLLTGNTVYALTGVVAGLYTVTVLTDKTFTITTVATTVLNNVAITFDTNGRAGIGFPGGESTVSRAVSIPAVSNNICQVTTALPHGLSTGNVVNVEGGAVVAGSYTITVNGTQAFTFTTAATSAINALTPILFNSRLINAAGNINHIAYNGVGDYNVNISVPMKSYHYCAIVGDDANAAHKIGGVLSKTVNSLNVGYSQINTSTARFDATYAQVTIFA